MSDIRTPEEIVAFYEGAKQRDWLGVIRDDLLIYLPRPHIEPYLKDAADDWTPEPLTRDEVLARMREYMPFAWDKAQGERGISAGRSIQHFQAWLFLLGDDEMRHFAEDDSNYPPYGMPILRAIAEKYGLPIQEPANA